jgi:hypothetical protein
VRWDDDADFRQSNRVSPWDVELTGSITGSHLSTPNSKRLKPLLPNVNPNYLVPRTFVVANGLFIEFTCVFILTDGFSFFC